MKLLTYIERIYSSDSPANLGILLDTGIVPLRSLNASDRNLPATMLDLLMLGEAGMQEVSKALEAYLREGGKGELSLDQVQLLAPLPNPGSCRDAYAFRQHVETSRRNRGLDMIPEFDEIPVFYFTNHRAINGPGDVWCMPLHFNQLDFELEVAIVLNKGGRNIKAAQADDYIAGFMVMNDLSARALQMQEMKLNLGPAKGKDFATVLGPWLVTPDELAAYETDPLPGHVGKSYNLDMVCRVNGKEVSRGNFSTMNWTFAEIIERASYGVDLYPGDVIGSGTVGTGCFLELNGTGRLEDPQNFQEQWLEPGDFVEMEVTGLGVLSNRVLLDPNI